MYNRVEEREHINLKIENQMFQIKYMHEWDKLDVASIYGDSDPIFPNEAPAE